LLVVDAERVNELARANIPSFYFLTVWLRKALRDLPELLDDDEELLTLAKGSSGSRAGVLAVTNRRALVVVGSPVQRRVESLPLNQVSSVQSRRGLFSGRVTIAMAGNGVVIRSIVPKARADEITDVVRSNLTAPGPQR
jgi:Bacterial PH domain